MLCASMLWASIHAERSSIAVVLLYVSLPFLTSQPIVLGTIDAGLGETKTFKAPGQAADWGCYVMFNHSDKDHRCCYQTERSVKLRNACKASDSTLSSCRNMNDISVKETTAYCEFTLNVITDNDFGDYNVVFLKHNDYNKSITVKKVESSGGGGGGGGSRWMWFLTFIVVIIIVVAIICTISVYRYLKFKQSDILLESNGLGGIYCGQFKYEKSFSDFLAFNTPPCLPSTRLPVYQKKEFLYRTSGTDGDFWLVSSNPKEVKDVNLKCKASVRSTSPPFMPVDKEWQYKDNDGVFKSDEELAWHTVLI